MLAHFEIHANQGYVEETFNESISKDELIAHLHSLLADPRWRSDLNALIDLSSASVDFHYADMRALVAFLKAAPIAATTRYAFVAPQAVNFGMLRMYTSLAGDLHDAVQVFGTREEALRWIVSNASTGC